MPFYGPWTERSAASERITRMLDAGDCVVLDGGVATELQRVADTARARSREPWGSWALRDAPAHVLEVHRRFVRAGADVISTNSWAILEGVAAESPDRSRNGLPAWTALAATSVRLARQAIAEAGREEECAVAFCINGDVFDAAAQGRLELLTWLWQEEAPDLVIFETLDRLPEGPGLAALDMVRETGLPLWISLRRCREGWCSVDGAHADSSDEAGFAPGIHELEERGVQALLHNCVPYAHLDGLLPRLAATTSLPLGVYPNLGGYAAGAWAFDPGVGPDEFARLGAGWHAAGAGIVGGCCGVTSEHIAGLAARVAADRLTRTA
jgi:S-methylmethionine-dependent homocysteine/selenocysteine methylase